VIRVLLYTLLCGIVMAMAVPMTGAEAALSVTHPEYGPIAPYMFKSIAPYMTPDPSPSPTVHPAAAPTTAPRASWALDPDISWYGPGFYGHRTACGLALTKSLIGVAHRTLPCGTIVLFKWNGVVVAAPVVDRGPYVSGRIFDMTGGLCMKLNHCFTGKIYYRIGG